MPCKHTNIALTVELQGVNKYAIIDISGPVGRRVSTRPVRMTCEPKCQDCGFSSRYSADAAQAHAGASAWPVWLLNHLAVLCEVDESLRRACIACHVPGITEVVHA